MSNDFLNLLPEEQSALIKKAGDHLVMPDMIIEKDLWVCWVLEKLFVLPVQMAFKGGTSLSKVFFGIRNSIEPSEKHPVIPYLAQVINQDIGLPKPIINILSPLRTFWEKATLIHVECHRERMTKSLERLSRHWYDLFMLKNSWVGEQALLNNGILKSVIEHKKAFFNASYANYDHCLSGGFRLIPENSYLKNLEKDFSHMLEAGMFHGLPQAFNTIIESLKSLEVTINQKQW